MPETLEYVPKTEKQKSRFRLTAREGRESIGLIEYRKEYDDNGPQVVVGHLELTPIQLGLYKTSRDKLGQLVRREANGKILDYTVINGTKIKQQLPYYWHMGMGFREFAEELRGEPMVPLHDQAAVNINIVGPGGQQGFHKDRNEVTILVYMSEPKGGALEYIDRDGKVKQVIPKVGTVVGLVGANELSHRVTPVEDDSPVERVAFVSSFGLPGKDYENDKRDNFLYTTSDEVKDQKVFDK